MASDIIFQTNFFFLIFARKAVGLIQNKYSPLGGDFARGNIHFSFPKIRGITLDIGGVFPCFLDALHQTTIICKMH